MPPLDDNVKTLIFRESFNLGKQAIISLMTPSQSQLLKEEAEHQKEVKEIEAEKYEKISSMMQEKEKGQDDRREEYRSNILNEEEDIAENLKKAKIYLEKAKDGTSCSSCIALIEDVEGTLDTSMEILIPATEAVKELEDRGETRHWEDLPEEVREDIKRNIKRSM